jgi:hypothetical protein
MILTMWIQIASSAPGSGGDVSVTSFDHSWGMPTIIAKIAGMFISTFSYRHPCDTSYQAQTPLVPSLSLVPILTRSINQTPPMVSHREQTTTALGVLISLKHSANSSPQGLNLPLPLSSTGIPVKKYVEVFFLFLC